MRSSPNEFHLTDLLIVSKIHHTVTYKKTIVSKINQRIDFTNRILAPITELHLQFTVTAIYRYRRKVLPEQVFNIVGNFEFSFFIENRFDLPQVAQRLHHLLLGDLAGAVLVVQDVTPA